MAAVSAVTTLRIVASVDLVGPVILWLMGFMSLMMVAVFRFMLMVVYVFGHFSYLSKICISCFNNVWLLLQPWPNVVTILNIGHD